MAFVKDKATHNLHGSLTFDGVGDGVGVGAIVGVGVGVGVTEAVPGQVCDKRIPELVELVAAHVPLCTMRSWADVGV